METENKPNILFSAQYEYNWEWLLSQQNRPLTKLNYIYKIIVLLLSIILLLVSCMMFAVAISTSAGFMTFLNAFVFFIIAAFLFFSNRINSKRRFKAIREIQGTDRWQIKFDFLEDKLKVYNGVQKLEIDYNQIGKLDEDKDMFYLYIEKSSAFRIPKDSFTIGSISDFEAFIKPLLGKLKTGTNYKGMLISTLIIAGLIIYTLSVFGPVFMDFL